MARRLAASVLITFALCAAAPLAAQVREIDPNTQIDADLEPLPGDVRSVPVRPAPEPAPLPSQDRPLPPAGTAAAPPAAGTLPSPTVQGEYAQATTYRRDDLIAEAEGVFGKGAEGLAGIIENILRDQGEPNAYIAGQEAAGAFVVGLRYGSGTMFHRVEGQRPVYWTGPSVGFDVGGDAAKTFILVYNLYDSQELYKRYPAAEGRAYFVGGFSASYMRYKDVVLIPIRLGVGWRLGANVGYMKFSERQRWLPF